ncbi:TonB-dependent copper receptor [Selenomonas sp. oral taxon 149]|uniref:TonB-dependent copper receptor n=1 Tax=Selenomonas sp. oral taxon 149 TaxID=712535 RepID=UPI0001E0BF2A|nr:TonB-dependent copper receptor [Selenomonas sp. oral taxon 149]EFM22621.1 TonB-dependent copper receptor [Selenomonas sp. oral taxon 149 str. 67H29BP]
MSQSMHRLAMLSMVFGTACFSTHVYAADPLPEDTHNAASTSTESSAYEATLGETVVTGYRTRRPLTLSTNPQRPRQPIPASDGAGYLKAIPGFSVVRKGGVGGDPMLRGMGGSRIVMNMNGGMMSGGCPNRMDPTATYAFPETFSHIIVNKGPQSVRYGASVAGNVVFERRTKRFERAGVRGNVSILGASNHRFDDLIDITAGDKEGYARFIQTRNYSRDYVDGEGRRIHSGYGRHSLTGIVGLTPDTDTLFEVSYDRSRGWAKYAHGMMDGSQFDRDSYAVKFERAHLSPVVKKLTLNFNYNTIDHIMDNYTFRPGGTRGMEVKRTQYNIRSVLDMTFSPRDTGAVGIDVGHEEHTFTPAMKGVPRGRENTDMTIGNLGLFMEYNHNLTERSRLLSGLRWDRITNHYHRYLTFTPGNTTDNAVSGFVRWERTSKNRPLTFYVGLGHAERPADYWESYHTWRMHGALYPGATRPAKEKNTQLDLGWVYAGKKTNASLSLYYAHVDDFILRKPVGGYGNVDARLYGLEAEVTRTVSPRWTLGASLAYTRGDDRTNDAPLPQIAPLEANLTAKYSHRKMEANAVWRLVSRQNRYHKGYGSVTGTDYGPTGGFGILSLSLAYRPDENLTLSLGVDNLLNKTYAEFVNYSEAAIPALGISAGGHITEPGRTIWFKSNYKF